MDIKEFTKTAINIQSLRKVVKLLRKRYPFRRLYFPNLISGTWTPTFGAITAEGLKQPIMKKLMPRAKKPFISTARPKDFFYTVSRKAGGPKLSETAKKVLKDISLLHEGSEMKYGIKLKKAVPQYFSHLDPAVLLEEGNIISTLPKKYSDVAKSVTAVRKATGESGVMEHHLPRFVFGKTRLSRHAKKRVAEILKRKMESAVGKLAAYKYDLFDQKRLNKFQKYRTKLFGPTYENANFAEVIAKMSTSGKPMSSKEVKRWEKIIERINQKEIAEWEAK